MNTFKKASLVLLAGSFVFGASSSFAESLADRKTEKRIETWKDNDAKAPVNFDYQDGLTAHQRKLQNVGSN